MVSVDQPASALDPKQIARAHRAVEPLHSHLYFAPEHDEHLSAIGLRPGRMAYFAGRAAPMGAVGAGVVTATFYNFSPSLMVDYALSDSTTLYGKIVEGYKAGGFNMRQADFDSSFGPEKLTSYELGWKSDLLRRKLRVNGAVFANEYTDMQLTPTSCPDLSPGPCAAPRNLGDADIWGAELESTFAGPHGLLLDAALSHIRLDFTRLAPEAIGPVDPTLDTPESTPPWKAGIGAQLDVSLGAAGTLVPRLDWSYEDEKRGLAGTSSLVVLLGNGLGAFTAHFQLPTGTEPGAVTVGDFDGDGILDLAVSHPDDGTVSIYLGARE